MKASFIFILFLFLQAGFHFTSLTARAQETGLDPGPKVYVVADQMPVFPGGQKALESFFTDSLAAKNIRSQRVTTLTMVISKSGQPQNIEIINGINPKIDETVLRIARQMPPWQPGKIKDEPVNVRKIVTVVFPPIELPETPEERDLIYFATDVAPEFPAGRRALMDHFRSNIDFTKVLGKKKLMGIVKVRFAIMRDSTVKNPEILQGLTPALDAEILRVLHLMPAWIPGKRKGRPINHFQELSIYVELPKQKNKSPNPAKIKFY